MLKPLSGKVITVIGSSGYVGSNVIKNALQYGAIVNGVSRSGQPTTQQNWTREVNWIKGDAMKAHEFKDILQKSDIVIHTIGTLIDSSVLNNKKPGDQGTYEQMNRDTALNVVKELINTNVKFVYVSGSAHPPFLKRYLTTKQEVEQHILSLYQQQQLNPIIVRPGFIYSLTQRWWSVPLKYDLAIWKCVHDNASRLIPQQSFIGKIFNEFKVDTSIDLQDVVDACLAPLKIDLIGKSLNNQEMEKVAQQFRNLQ
ncbi:unnamed protein product [Paramecium primaurelia]|uniref:NAD-dependent epimerase/dehydratase domain-containing protein n=1 Tax=Paramecium primaurelia TaxID=5886 RepID=A0A8S1JPV8_PARPR|nr:unnamed protein product [Paramecium primaurelia]